MELITDHDAVHCEGSQMRPAIETVFAMLMFDKDDNGLIMATSNFWHEVPMIGFELGRVLGRRLGTLVGDAEGLEGRLDGLFDGRVVGAGDGNLVGLTEGWVEGAALGEGSAVGFAVRNEN